MTPKTASAGAGPGWVVGVDAGGTHTRAVVVGVDGVVVGAGLAGGGNQRSSGDEPVESLAAALRHALTGVEPGTVAGGVVGMAGAGGPGDAARAKATAIATEAWRRCGLPGVPHVATDLEAAFAAGTTQPAGALLAAGTGAVAAAFAGRAVTRRADGYGWLGGDAGSGVWIGRAAARAVLAALDGRSAGTALVGPVCAALLDGQTPARLPTPGGDAAQALAQRLVAALHAGAPDELGRLAPLVEAAARAGDRVALRLVSAAARQLCRTLRAVGADVRSGPLVLAGALLDPGTLVGARVHASLGGWPTRHVRSAAVGAAALACHRLLSPDAALAAHRRLLNHPDV